MPRPEPRLITFTIDGREVQAPENAMLVDAAKYGDVEIPFFCYEPKLGNPVGACRMCLVEVEGIPKLQTGCSTPVKDGMVVNTHTERVRVAQEAVVEFLLVNHPLDCPVCDKGGECPLQDITFGWGGGISRFVEPKRHFVKPLELSPLIAIDRERCILCYRCVRFSQEVAEDYQLVLLERGADSYVATYDGHPYVAPFSGNITELCPVGALTSRTYRFRARPWDIEGAGSVCTLCPSQCNVTLTVRDERVVRVLARDHHEVDDGWLCDKGRYAFQAIHVEERVTEPLLRDGGILRPVSWERALAEAASGLRRARGKAAAVVGGQSTNEEGLLLSRVLREGLESADIDSRGGLDPRALQRLHAPDLQASVADLEYAHTVLVLGAEPVDDAPILDLRLRKGVRRNRMSLVMVTARPSSLDPSALTSLRYAPGSEAATVGALAAALTGGDVEAALGEDSPGLSADAVRSVAELVRDGGEDVVVLWSDRLLRGDAEGVTRSLLAIAEALKLSGRPGAGLLGIPAETNGRGLLEAGVAPGVGPGFAAAAAGRGAPEIAGALVDGQCSALYLLHCDPLRSLPDRQLWTRALDSAATVVAHAEFLTEGVREHADVVFPAEAYAEKEGTVTHPDGRLQRLRPAIARPGEVRAEWRVLVDLAARLGLDLDVPNGAAASAQLFEAVPFYGGLTLELIAGHGARWQERDAASAYPSRHEDSDAPRPAGEYDGEGADDRGSEGADTRAVNGRAGALRLGTYRSVWAAPEVEASPTLQFLIARQALELSPADAQRLGVGQDDLVEVARAGPDASPPNGNGDAHAQPVPERFGRVRARVAVRADMPAGAVFLQEGIREQAANALTDGGTSVLVSLQPVGEPATVAVPAGGDPAATNGSDSGHSEDP